MKKIISRIDDFRLNNKILFWMLIASIIIFLAYNLTMEEKEMFTGAEFIFNTASQLSLTYIGSFVFYIIQVYIPEKNGKEKMKENINYYLCEVLDTMNHIYDDICHDYLEEPINSVISESQFKKIKSKFKLSDKVELDGGKRKITYYEYILSSTKKVEKQIDKIYIRLGSFLDEDIKVLLVDISNSSLHCYFESVDPGYLNNIYWGQITEYYELCIRLIKYIKENE